MFILQKKGAELINKSSKSPKFRVIVDADNTYVEDVDQDYLHTYNSLDWEMPSGPYICFDCGTREYTREELDEVQYKKEKAKSKEPVLRGGSLPKEDA